MSGSEAGVMTSSNRAEPFGVGLQKSPIPPSQPAIQHMRLPFSTEGSAVFKPVEIPSANNPPPFPPSSAAPDSGGGGAVTDRSTSGAFPAHGINVNAGIGGEAGKKKRGRPRKYGPDGSLAIALVQSQTTQPVAQPQQPPHGGGGNNGDGGFLSPRSITGGATAPSGAGGGGGAITVAPPPSDGPNPVSPGVTKRRGRPPGSCNKKRHVSAMGSVPVGFGFLPHIITVKAGEDVSSRIMAFSQHGPRSICILSATGAISNVTIRQPSTSGGTVTYEGKFEILSLSGSFTPLEKGGQWSRTGGLQVALSGSDGRVLGGGVAGVLIAATPIQLVVGSFIAESEKQQKAYNHYMEPVSAPGRLIPAGGPTGSSSSPSRGTPNESSGGPVSPIHPNSGAYNNSGISSMSWK